MDFKNRLTSSRAEYSVIKHQFLLNVDAHGAGIHIFLENINDQSFYGNYIRGWITGDLSLYTYNCNNKDGVYEVQHKLNYKEFTNEIFMFFVDKDLDDIIPTYRESHPDIYVTTYYSIENFLVTGVIVEQIWAEIFKQGSSLISKDICEKFEASLEIFYCLATKITSWIIYHRRIGNKPTLKNIKIKTFLEITEDYDVQQKILDSELIDALDSQGGVKTKLGGEYEINNISQELIGINPKIFVRGKFEIEFFVEFIKKLREEVNKAPKKQHIHLDITTSNAIDLLAPRVKCPPCLNCYLSSKLT